MSRQKTILFACGTGIATSTAVNVAVTEAMKKRGLTVVPVDAKTRAEWLQTAESFYPKIRGPIVPAAAFDQALKLRDELRAAKAAHKP
jgi:hypothetical protein